MQHVSSRHQQRRDDQTNEDQIRFHNGENINTHLTGASRKGFSIADFGLRDADLKSTQTLFQTTINHSTLCARRLKFAPWRENYTHAKAQRWNGGARC
jgi:hypothetical protein